MAKPPTLADVARRAGVSVSTASIAFSGSGPVSEATRAKVVAAAAELGYRGPHPVARSLRRGHSGVVGVVVGRLANSFRDPVSAKTLDGTAGELGERGLGLLLIPVAPGADPTQPWPLPQALRTAAMDAAIVWGPPPDDPALLELLARGVPTVSLDGSPRQGVPTVGIDDLGGMGLVLDHLMAAGHTRIAVVSLPRGHQRHRGSIPLDSWRTAGYASTRRRLRALADHGLAPTAVLETTGSSVEEGKAAGLALLTGPDRPTAIVALSDFLASGLVIAARELGMSIPDDVAITGFDGLDLPWLAPDVLTTVDQPLGEKGRLAADYAARLALGEHDLPDLTLPVQLRRGTTS